jgi:hypothetical protein|tara:strand:- start:587 stop:841 length:255 start_codon:yes stop_codon:yes gene_type:complete
MRDNIRVNGWDFEYVENDYDDKFYQCRGEVMYDDEHDQIPEPSLWQAAEKLENILAEDGIKSYAGHSEKGWVEVTISNVHATNK